MKNVYPYLLLILLFIGANTSVNAQCDPLLRPDSTQLTFNGAVNTSVKVGNILYVGGNFTTVSRNTGSFIKVDAGSTGSILGLATWPKVNAPVNAIVSDGAGGWIISGTFTQVGTATRNRIAQINAIGQVTSWDPNANGAVSALYRNGTTLYVGGSFTTIGGQSRNRIASFDLSTGNITSWDPNANSSVVTLAVNGTSVYAGGSFTTIGGQTRARIAELDATTGLATTWNPGVTGTVNKLVINGSVIYLGGAFSNAGATARSNVAAIDISTGLTTSWNPSANATVTDIAINGSNIFLSGTFTNVGSQARNGVAEVDNNLGNATSRNFGLSATNIACLKLSGNSLYIGGTFTLTSAQANIARLNLTTNTVDAWESNFNTTVNVIETSGTNVYVGGNFSSQFRNRTYVAAIDWIADSLLQWAPVLNSSVTALAANTSNVYIGGNFTTVNTIAKARLASVAANGTLNAWTPNPNSTVSALLLSGNTLYAGGVFTQISSQTRNRAAAYDITTGALTSWDPNINGGNVQAMVIAGSNMYLGGSFTTANGTTTSRLRAAAVNLTSGTLVGWNPAPDNTVNALAVSGTDIYVGGSFNNIDSKFRPRLAVVDQTTGVANTWSPYPNGAINSIAIDGNTLYAGGFYSTIGGQSRNNLAAVDLTTGNATTWDPSASSTVNHVAVYGDRLLVGGLFTTISSQTITPNATQYNLLKTTPVVSITGNNNVCASTSVTFTAVTSVAGATYQWKKNGINVGTNSTYTTVPVNNDQVQCVITTPIGSCYTSSTATSNTITVSITSPITPTATVTGNTTVCSGTATTYTAVTNVPGPTYQWIVNGNNVGTNSTTFTYTPNNGDVVTCKVITPATGCFSASSVTATALNIIVTIPVTPSVTISTPLTTVCQNASVTFTSTTNIVGGTYQWKNGTTVVGTASTYTVNNLTNGASITCTVTIPVGGCYTASSIASSPIVMTITPNVTPTASISGNINPCSASAATYTATTNIVGGTYQWKVNGVNAGTNSTYTYTPVANDVLTCTVTIAPGTCYTSSTVVSNSLVIIPQTAITPTATVTGSNNLCAGQTGTYIVSTNVTGGTYQWKVNTVNSGTASTYAYVPINGDIVNVVITTPTTSGCYSAPTVTSNNFPVTVNNPVLPTITVSTTSPTTICSGVPVVFDGTLNNVPGGTYQWRVNGSNVSGATNSTFIYVPANGNKITCAITIPVGGCYLASTSISNEITMTVTPSTSPNISVSAGANNICLGTVVNYTATTNIVGGTYQWKVNGVTAGTSSAAYSYSPVNGDVVTCTITVPGTGCFTTPSVTSSGVTMQVNAPVVPSIGVTADNDTVCEGSTVNLTATTNITGGTYLWKVNGVNAGTNNSTYSYVPANNDIILCTIITPPGCFASSTATSVLKIIKVKAKVAAPFTVAVVPIAELNSTVHLGITVPAGVTAYSIDWKKNGTTFATTSTNTTTYVKTAGIDTITATLTPADGCYTVGTSPAAYVYSVGTGINDAVKTSGIEVYPNPFNDRITIQGLASGDKVLLFDMTGRNVANPMVADHNNGRSTLMLNDIAAGAYLLKVVSKDGNAKANIPVRKL